MDVTKYEKLDHNKFDPDKVDYRIKKMVEDVVRKKMTGVNLFIKRGFEHSTMSTQGLFSKPCITFF